MSLSLQLRGIHGEYLRVQLFIGIPGHENRFELDPSETNVHADRLVDYAHAMTIVDDVILPNNKTVFRQTRSGEVDVVVYGHLVSQLEMRR